MYYVSPVEEKAFGLEDSSPGVKKKFWKGVDINEWHRRLGHLSEEIVKKTVPINGSVDYCEACMSGRFDRKPFNEVANNEKELLERVYTDICGPMDKESFGGYRYFISFIDGYSKFAEVFLMSHKSEAEDCFRLYKKRVEVETGK